MIDKRPVLTGSTIHEKKIGQVLEAGTLKSKKEKNAKRNPHIRKPHLQLKGRIWQTLEAIKREPSSSKMKKTNLRGEEKNVQCTSSKRGKTNLEGGILINKNTKRRSQILEVGDSHLQKKEKNTNLRGERKHCQRYYGPRRWLHWPMILVW